MKMDLTKLHWNIFDKLNDRFTYKIREFLVIGTGGEGLVMITEPNGEAFWYGKKEFGLDWNPAIATKPTPLGVTNLVQMAQGENHVLLLNGLGQIYGMGRNNEGQLGLGNCHTMKLNDLGQLKRWPQLIPSDNKYISIRCGWAHSLALTGEGKVWGWGRNASGQLGLPISSPVPSPRQIIQLDPYRVVAIECGGSHSLALTDQGKVYAWGNNRDGQLGSHSNLSTQFSPTLLSISSPIIQIAAGLRHTLLLNKDGLVFSCGSNFYGPQKMETSSTTRLCQVSDLPSISRISSHCSTFLSIALSTEQRCYVWGWWNKANTSIPLQLPSIYSTVDSPLSFGSNRRNTPRSVCLKELQSQQQSPNSNDILDTELIKLNWEILQKVENDFVNKIRQFLVISGGDGVLMTTEPDGEGFWYGEMKFGWGTLRKVNETTRLGVSGLVRMAQGREHILLLDHRGQCYAMGMNNKGQMGLGNGHNEIFFAPKQITSSPKFISVKCGPYHSLGLSKDGKVWGCGWNESGEIRSPGSTCIISSFQQIIQLDSLRVISIECGARHSLALTDKGQVYAWGDNKSGQLGHSKQSDQPSLVPLSHHCPVIQIAASESHTLLLTGDGLVFACGSNDSGQLGLPISIRSSFILDQVQGLPRISQIASHFDISLSIAFSIDQRCWVWGQWKGTKISTPLQLDPIYATIESPLSSVSYLRKTSNSIRLNGPHLTS